MSTWIPDELFWMFRCAHGLRSNMCQSFVLDKRSRGYEQYVPGCPACANRIPSNDETADAEGYHERLLEKMGR